MKGFHEGNRLQYSSRNRAQANYQRGMRFLDTDSRVLSQFHRMCFEFKSKIFGVRRTTHSKRSLFYPSGHIAKTRPLNRPQSRNQDNIHQVQRTYVYTFYKRFNKLVQVAPDLISVPGNTVHSFRFGQDQHHDFKHLQGSAQLLTQ